jgi:hypothetical protein
MGYCDRDLTRFERHRGLRRLIAQDGFEMMVVTATIQKARRLRHAFQEKPIHRHVPIHVMTLPELIHFLAPPPIANFGNIPR